MHPDLETLMVLDSQDRQLQALSREEQRWKRILHEAVQRAQREDEAREAARRAMRENQQRQATLERRITELEQRRCSTLRALDAGLAEPTVAEEQIRAIAALLDTLETELLERMEAQPALEEALAEADGRAREAASFLDAQRAAHGPKMDELRKRREALLPERRATLEQLDPHLAQRYEALLARKDRAVAPIENGACSCCQMVVRQQIVTDLKRGRIHTCGGCGRWLLPPV